MNNSFSIRPLETADAAEVSAFMRAQPSEYLRFFYAFSSDETALAEMLSRRARDVYSGVFWRDELVGLFFLRGWDAGFELPSLGVLVDVKYRGKGILGLMIDSAKLIVRLSGAKTIIAKSHPDNAGLKNLLRIGFRQVDVEKSSGNTIWHLEV